MLWEALLLLAGLASERCTLVTDPTPTLHCVAAPATGALLTVAVPDGAETAVHFSAGRLCETARCARCLTAAPAEWRAMVGLGRWRSCGGVEPFALDIDFGTVAWSLCCRALAVLLTLDVARLLLARLTRSPPTTRVTAAEPASASTSDGQGFAVACKGARPPEISLFRRRLGALAPPQTKTGEFACSRFIAGSKGDVQAAVTMYKKYLDWRARERVDDVLREPPLSAEAEAWLDRYYFIRVLSDPDLYERPVLFLRLGKVDLADAKRVGVTVQTIMRRHVRELERLQARIETAPYPERGHLILQDVHGCTLGLALRAWELFYEVAKVGQEYYPELLGTMCTITGYKATVASWFLDRIKKLIDPVTALKIQVHFGDPEQGFRQFGISSAMLH